MSSSCAGKPTTPARISVCALMSQSPVITLTEALTLLAFGRSLTRDELAAESPGGSLGQPTAVELQLSQAVQHLCGAGYVGTVTAFGVRLEEGSTSGRREQLFREDFL